MKTNAGTSILEWLEESVERIQKLGDDILSSVGEKARSIMDNMVAMSLKDMGDTLTASIETYIVARVTVLVNGWKSSLPSEIAAEASAEAYTSIGVLVANKCSEQFDIDYANAQAGISAMISQYMTQDEAEAKAEVDIYAAAAAADKLLENGVVAPDVGDVLSKSEGLALIGSNKRALLRKLGKQLAFTSKIITEDFPLGVQRVLMDPLWYYGKAITEKTATFADDVNEYPYVDVTEGNPVHTSIVTPLYHVGVKETHSFWWEVTYEKYNTITGKAQKATYKRTAFADADLLSEQRGIDEYLYVARYTGTRVDEPGTVIVCTMN